LLLTLTQNASSSIKTALVASSIRASDCIFQTSSLAMLRTRHIMKTMAKFCATVGPAYVCTRNFGLKIQSLSTTISWKGTQMEPTKTFPRLSAFPESSPTKIRWPCGRSVKGMAGQRSLARDAKEFPRHSAEVGSWEDHCADRRSRTLDAASSPEEQCPGQPAHQLHSVIQHSTTWQRLLNDRLGNGRGGWLSPTWLGTVLRNYATARTLMARIPSRFARASSAACGIRSFTTFAHTENTLAASIFQKSSCGLALVIS
jgi:hypothetical protein